MFSALPMDISSNQLLLKRGITVKAVVTPRWKDEAQQQLQGQMNQLDGQLQQLKGIPPPMWKPRFKI
jgi:hypothetical protein